MGKDALREIIDAKMPCFFISPHFDDAAYSAGSLILFLSRHTDVHIVNVFTAASSAPYSFLTRSFLRKCGYKNADALFQDRSREDKAVFAELGIAPDNLGFIDAAWRKIERPGLLRRFFSRIFSESGFIYPVYRLSTKHGALSSYDKDTAENLGRKLQALTADRRDAVIFCPLALRAHIDHVLVREVCLKNFENVILWADFPYNVRNPASAKEIDALAGELFHFEENPEMKLEMIRAYASQMKAMFPDGHIPLTPEAYYSPRKKNFYKKI